MKRMVFFIKFILLLITILINQKNILFSQSYNYKVARWMSTDPVFKPYETPYCGLANNPILYVDHTGGDNIIYVVVLPGAYTSLSKTEINEIIDKANEYYRSNGLKTEVRLFDGKKFNMSNMDQTDGVTVMGSQKEIVRWSKDQKANYTHATDFAKQAAGALGTHVEETDYHGRIIGFNTDLLKDEAKSIDNQEVASYGGFLILHGSGHLAGFSHEGVRHGVKVHVGSFMTSGQASYDILTGSNPSNYSIEDFAKGISTSPMIRGRGQAANAYNKKSVNANMYLIPAMKDRFGDNTAKDNYKTNEENK